MPKATSATRFLKPTVKWSDIDKLVNPGERTNFLAFKGKSESYFRRVIANPETPPPINWEGYKKIVPDPSIVDKMKSAYESFTVPYPTDSLSAQVDKQWQDLGPKIKSYCDEQQKVISAAQKELQRINSLPPFNVMTMEMFHDMYPELAIRPVAKPTFWPHTPEEQLGYVDPTAEKHGH